LEWSKRINTSNIIGEQAKPADASADAYGVVRMVSDVPLVWTTELHHAHFLAQPEDAEDA
jgi:hypothetical protein